MFHKNSDDAKWRVISGLKAGKEGELSSGELRAGVGRLFAEVEKMMVEEMKGECPRAERQQRAAELKRKRLGMTEGAKENGVPGELPPPRPRPLSPGGERGDEARLLSAGGERGESARTYLWDPVRTVCVRL